MLFLLFQIGGESYALDARRIVEIVPLVMPKALPGAPRGVAGLFDYRGTSIPLVDLSELATGRPAERRVSTRIVVLRYPTAGPERLLGLIVQRAQTTIRRAEGEFVTSDVDAAHYLGGVTRHDDVLVQRIEVERLLPPDLQSRLFQPANGA